MKPLHWHRRARTQRQSKRPALWPAFALAPPLGNTGGTLYDMSGNGRHVTHNGTWATGPSGPNVRLAHASSQAITGPTGVGDVPANGRMAIVLAFRPITIQAQSVLASKGAAASNGWYLQSNADRGLNLVTSQSGATQSSFILTNAYPASGLTVIVVNIAIPSVRLWCNGVDATTAVEHIQPVAAAATPLYIGKYSTTGAQFFTSMDVEWFSIIERALTTAEIKQLTADVLSALRRGDE
jgi:hypothetical protein